MSIVASLPAAARGWRQQDGIALLTPSYRRDLARCELLCESVDRHVRDRGIHYLVVHDEDVPLFAGLAGPARIVLPTSRFVPSTLRPIPLLRWRGRRYWRVPGGTPVSGWHVQQIVKIQAAVALPAARVCMVDSDNVFFRDVSLGALDAPAPVPLLAQAAAVTRDKPRHVAWCGSASRLLGLPAPELPADDYIDQIIVWDRATVAAMLARIESVTGRGWVRALCRERQFSEYMLYGAFVTRCGAPTAHRPTGDGLCRAYWDADGLDEDRVLAMMESTPANRVALCVQSFGETPPAVIGRATARFRAARAGTAPGAHAR